MEILRGPWEDYAGGKEGTLTPFLKFSLQLNVSYLTTNLNLYSYIPVMKSSRPFHATFFLAQLTLSLSNSVANIFHFFVVEAKSG
jgi:hypothetical protein